VCDTGYYLENGQCKLAASSNIELDIRTPFISDYNVKTSTKYQELAKKIEDHVRQLVLKNPPAGFKGVQVVSIQPKRR